MRLTQPLKVYVPREGAPLFHSVRRGAGMVGSVSDADPGRVRVDYDDRIGKFSNIRNYADRVMNAADRHVTNYPTHARLWVPPEELVEVGLFDGERVRVTDEAALAAWLGSRPGEDDLILSRDLLTPPRTAAPE